MSPRTRKPTRAVQLGVTDDDYARMLAAQDGHCALCPATPKSRRFSVDHDHATGAVRGLLCHRCNRNLPTWVTPEWLTRATAYLNYGVPALDLVLAARELTWGSQPPNWATQPKYGGRALAVGVGKVNTGTPVREIYPSDCPSCGAHVRGQQQLRTHLLLVHQLEEGQ